MNVNDQSTNPLNDIYFKFLEFPINFRTKVEEECGWNTPSFYRRMRWKPPIISIRQGNAAISKAEMDKIIQLALEFAEDLLEFCEEYTKK